MIDCGKRLEGLLESARCEVWLVAPFIKQRIVRRLFERVPTDVAISVYTRWRPDEVAAGVSDLGVFDEVLARPGTTLSLCAELHAKYYRSDERVLIGSANLTAAALGWAPASNLELLVESSRASDHFEAFEQRLSLRSVRATAEIRDLVQLAADALPSIVVPEWPSAVLAGTVRPATWMPHTRHPEVLFRAYADRGEELTSSGQEQTCLDLAVLGLPRGLREDCFRAFVGSILIQTPVVVALDALLDRPRRFGELRDFVAGYAVNDASRRDPSESWQTLMRWLLWFLPQRYASETPRYSEIFSRRPIASAPSQPSG